MSTQLKRKIRKKKKKNAEDETGPKIHERVGNYNFYSEEIAKNIIEKIISLVFSCNFVGKIDKKSNNFCFDSIKQTLDNIIQITHINHDNDDFDIDKIDIHTYIKNNKSDKDIKRFFLEKHKNALEARNDNTEKYIMNMANISKDFMTYMITKNKKIEDCLNKSLNIPKNKYIKKPKLYQYDINIEKNNFWGDIPLPQTGYIDRTSSNFNTYIPKKEEINKNIVPIPKKVTIIDDKKKDTNTKDSKKKAAFNYKNFIARLSKNFSLLKLIKPMPVNDQNDLTKKKRIAMVDMPSFPLENLPVRKEAEEILKLRKETMEMMIQKEKELKKQQMLKMKLKKEEAENEKMKKKGKISYDNDGNLIIVNEIKQENLFQEFWPITSKQKEIKQGKSLEYYLKEKVKMEKNAKNNIIYNDEDYPSSNSYLIKSRLTEPFININDSKLNFNKANNIFNPIQLRRRFNGFFFDNHPKQKIEPSGSNFHIINPSVGVVIKERAFEKRGGNDYYKEFKKYSIEEFNKTLQDTIEWAKYKQNEPKNINEGFNTTQAKGYNIFRKSILFNSKEENNNEPNSIFNIAKDDSNSNYIKRIKRNIKYQKKQDNFRKTFSKGFINNDLKKTMLKSTSEIAIENEKYIYLKKILFHEEKEKNDKLIPNSNIYQNNIHIFKHTRNHSSQIRGDIKRGNKNDFYEIDNLNKNLVTGKARNQSIFYQKMVLPKIMERNKDNNFNRTMMHFHRDRNKKAILDNFEKSKDSIIKSKKIRKVKSMKYS